MIGAVIVRKYLSPTEPSFWRWEDEAEAIEFNDGVLLAFRAQLAETLDRLEGNGLPPLGAVLLAIGSSMHRPDQDAPGSDSIRDLCLKHHKNGQIVPDQLVDRVGEKLRLFTDTIYKLNDRAMTHTALEMVFEACPIEVNQASAQAVIDVVKAGPPPEMVKGVPGRDAFDRLLLDLRTLDVGLESITPEAVRRRHNTGLEEIPEPAEVVEPDLPVHAAAMQLIEQLEAEEEHNALGKVARQVHAAIRMPRRLGSPDDLPLGGLSDVTNRGQLDRLLVSELAQDDLTLAIRVASNEALYLRREESHTRLPTSRHLLIDLGLTQWGVSRVMSIASALALHAMGDEQIDLQCWCATHQGIESTALHRRDALEQILARLEVNLSLKQSIDALAEKVKDEPSAELIVVLSADQAHDGKLLHALCQWRGAGVHFVSVARSGRIAVSSASPQGLREVGHTQVDVESLANGATPKRRLLTDPSRDSDLPAAVRQAILPLRVPHQLKDGSYWYCDRDGGRMYAITSDHRLTRWENAGYGPVELFDRLPRRELLWHAPQTGEVVDALIGRVGKKPEVSAISIDHQSGSMSLQSIDLPIQGHEKRVVGVCCHRGTILVTTDIDALAIDPETSELLARRQLKDGCRVLKMSGRCVQLSDGTWYGLSYSGNTIRIYVTCAKEALERGERIASAFNVRGLDGFVNITNKGRVLMPRDNKHNGTQLVTWPNEIYKVRHSSNGRVIAISTRDTRKNQAVHLQVEIVDDQVHLRKSSQHELSGYIFHKDTIQRCNPRSVRVNFQMAGFGRDRNGEPALYIKTRKIWLRMQLQQNQLTVVDAGKAKPSADVIGFKPITSPPGTRYELFEASIGDRGRVVRDTRGMLHIQASDSSLPEVSIVIEGHRVSGWCSDGQYFGDGYYYYKQNKKDRKWDNHIASTQTYGEIIRPILEHFV